MTIGGPDPREELQPREHLASAAPLRTVDRDDHGRVEVLADPSFRSRVPSLSVGAELGLRRCRRPPRR